MGHCIAHGWSFLTTEGCCRCRAAAEQAADEKAREEREGGRDQVDSTTKPQAVISENDNTASEKFKGKSRTHHVGKVEVVAAEEDAAAGEKLLRRESERSLAPYALPRLSRTPTVRPANQSAVLALLAAIELEG